MTEPVRNSQNRNHFYELKLRKMQSRYILGGIFLLPFAPFLFLQAKYTRWKVGRLPDAGGSATGAAGKGEETIKLLAIGESSVAGIGAKTHEEALTGQFARHLGLKTGKRVEWQAQGVSGITVRRVLRELIPEVSPKGFDVVLIALGGNDVFNLNSPEGFRKDMSELLGILRQKNPKAKIFLANVPMVRDFIALPNPLRYVLSQLAKLHHFNAINLVSGLTDVYYFDDVNKVDDDFFSDGIHPSVNGYDLWSEAMVGDFLRKSQELSGQNETL